MVLGGVGVNSMEVPLSDITDTPLQTRTIAAWIRQGSPPPASYPTGGPGFVGLTDHQTEEFDTIVYNEQYDTKCYSGSDGHLRTCRTGCNYPVESGKILPLPQGPVVNSCVARW
jgi:hypothetical protein